MGICGSGQVGAYISSGDEGSCHSYSPCRKTEMDIAMLLNDDMLGFQRIGDAKRPTHLLSCQYWLLYSYLSRI